MWIKVIKDGLCNDYESKSKWTALFFVSTGFITLIYTLFSQVNESTIVGSALFISGLYSLFYTSKENVDITASWFKSFVYFSAGIAVFFLNIEILIPLFSLLFVLFSLNSLYFSYLTRQDATAISWFLDALLSISFASYLFLHPDTQLLTAAMFIGIHLILEGFVLLFSGRKIYIRP